MTVAELLAYCDKAEAELRSNSKVPEELWVVTLVLDRKPPRGERVRVPGLGLGTFLCQNNDGKVVAQFPLAKVKAAALKAQAQEGA